MKGYDLKFCFGEIPAVREEEFLAMLLTWRRDTIQMMAAQYPELYVRLAHMHGSGFHNE